ncbi:MAG: tetratricopeptide repeat protein [Heliobacteriaceae bacterium]|nr:tetratricopeptide repeat protein [Heliobacteriaceae bacterium]
MYKGVRITCKKRIGLFLCISCSVVALSALNVSAADLYDRIEPVNPLEIRTAPDTMVISVPKRAALTHNDVHNHYAIAFDRFVQSNVKSAYSNFRVLIETIVPNDYAYMLMAENMADIGLFNLSGLAMSKIDDKDVTNVLSDDIKRYYFPSKKLKVEDEIYLGEVYSNIIYNDQSREAAAELIKNTALLADSDYANYVAALGYLKSGNAQEAEKYINIALGMNPQNINYKKLYAEIVAQGKKPQNALKIVEDIKQQRLYSVDFSNKVNSLEQYILYKTKKNEIQKMYHLGYYYYCENELHKSARTLQGALSGNIRGKKSINADVYALLARVYFDMNEFEKAQDTAAKAYKLKRDDPVILLVLGDLRYREKDYKGALRYYEDAHDKNSWIPAIKAAQTYQMLNKEKKAAEVYDKVLKNFSDAYLAYYNVALKDKTKEIPYLKKALALNMAFKDGWIDLGRVETERRNFAAAKKYLQIAYYIDENDFRYYYYQGLLFKNQGLKEDAQSSFRKSLILNPDYAPAKEEISI